VSGRDSVNAGNDAYPQVPKGSVPLAWAIAALRDELTLAWSAAQGAAIRFKPSPVELTLQLAVTSEGKGKAGVKWYVIELGGEYSRQSAVTQTVKMTLTPVLLNEQGREVEFLVEAPDEAGLAGDEAADAPLDAPDSRRHC
jgi:Trypsin-co-occurring domain 2